MSNLLVQNIKHTNNTTAMTVDSSGRITEPNRPSFQAVVGSESWATLSDTGIIPFNDVSSGACFDTGGDFDTSNNRFVAPVSGKYHFFVLIYSFNSDSVNAFCAYKNGAILRVFNNSTRFDFQGGQAGSVDETISGSFQVDLSASDNISIHATTGSDYYGAYTHFGGHLIG
jgi:hypothetical protein